MSLPTMMVAGKSVHVGTQIIQLYFGTVSYKVYEGNSPVIPYERLEESLYQQKRQEQHSNNNKTIAMNNNVNNECYM